MIYGHAMSIIKNCSYVKHCLQQTAKNPAMTKAQGSMLTK